MNTRTAPLRWITAIILGVIAFVSVLEQSTHADDWATLANTPPPGVSSKSWANLAQRFREKPYTVAEINPCLETIAIAAREQLPIEPLLVRLEEGVVKKADAVALARAVQQRLDALQNAQKILKESGFSPDHSAPQQELVVALATAIESGVPADGLRTALKSGNRTAPSRIRTSVEAAESLKLMGLGDETVSSLMEDFVKRNLSDGEILRATRFVGRQYRGGMSDQQIRGELWKGGGRHSSPTSTERPGHGHGRGRGGPP